MVNNIGSKLGVFGALLCCLGLTQTGPCPLGQPPLPAGGETCATPTECTRIECQVAACTDGNCVYTSAAEGTACENDDTEGDCNGPDSCNPEGECQDNEVADNDPCLSGQDTNSCTNDVCDGGACTHPPVVDGTACGDAADAGTCVAGVCELNAVDGTVNLAVFVDPETNFFTTDVRDVDDEIVRFDTSTNSIIWATDGTAYEEGQWDVNGVLLAGGFFQVRFGTKDGERRAYFTEVDPPTICQIEPVNGFLSISRTNVAVPQE